MNKKLYWGLGVLFLLITGVFVLLLVQQKAELAKYKEDYALPTEKVAKNENNKKPPQNGHWHGDEWHDAPHGTHTSYQNFTDVPVPSDTPDTSIPAQVAASENLDELNRILAKEWNDFTIKLQRKYPVLFDSQELARVAQTKEGRKKLKRQVESIIEEQLDQFESLFSQLPPKVAAESLRVTESLFMKNNQGLPPKHIKQAFERMRAKLN